MSGRTQRWLTIVVDGNTALNPYWPRIVSQCIAKIVRSFSQDCFDKENKEDFELGLVLSASNSTLGYNVQIVNWTSDVDLFLGCLPSLVLNGDDSNQTAMTEGLVKALTMYPLTQAQRVKRHCVLVAIGEPVPQKTQMYVPVVQDGVPLGTQMMSQNVDVFEVAQMFPKLDVSFSVITPIEHPSFRAMFNLGNNVIEEEHEPLTNYRIGEFFVMLSKNFKDSLEVFGEQTIEAAGGVTLEIQESELALPFAASHTHDAAGSSSITSMNNIFDDMVAELSANDDVIFLSTNISSSSSPFRVFNLQDLFEPDNIPFDHSGNSNEQQQQQAISSNTMILSLEELGEFEAGFEQALKGFTDEHEASRNNASNATDLASSSSTQVINALLVEPNNSPSPCAGTLSTTPVMESNSSHAVPQTTMSLSPAGPQASQGEVNRPQNRVIDSVAALLGLDEPSETHQTSPVAGFAYGDSLFPDASGVTLLQFETDSSSSPEKFPGHSSIIHFGQSSPTTPQQDFHSVGTKSASRKTRRKKKTSGTPSASHSAAKKSSSIKIGASSLAQHETPGAANTQFSSHYAMGTSSLVQSGTPSSAPHAPGDSSIVPLQLSSPALPQVLHHGQGTGAPSGSFSTLQMQPNSPAWYNRLSFVPSLSKTSALGRNKYAPPASRMSQIFDMPYHLPLRSSYVDFSEYEHTWEGSISGWTYPSSNCFYKALGFKKTIAPPTHWGTDLFISSYIPIKAVEYTKSILITKPFSMFFYISVFDNFDLYHYMKKEEMIARIDLPCQALLLSPTENVFFYEGEVYPRDTIFIEPGFSAQVMNTELNSADA